MRFVADQPRRTNHRVTEVTEYSGKHPNHQTQAKEYIALQLGFVFSVFSVTLW